LTNKRLIPDKQRRPGKKNKKVTYKTNKTMDAKYQLVRNSDFNGSSEDQTLHARIVSKGTIRLTDMMEVGSDRSSFTPADIKGALQLIADLLEEGLSNGYNVELDGIGYFSVSLSCRPETDAKKIRSESIRFRDVNFRLGKEMKKRLRGMRLYRQPVSRKRSFTAEIREQRLWSYLTSHLCITTRDYMSLNSCAKHTALKELKLQIEAGTLVTVGPRNNTTYMKSE